MTKKFTLKCFFVLLIIFITMYFSNILLAASNIKGSGDKDSPYLITNESQLMAIANGKYNNNYTAYYELQNDIELTKPWVPIGGNGKAAFSGVFDGNGYKISNVSINRKTKNYFAYSGLFGVNEGIIKNLGVSVNISNAQTAGGIAGKNSKNGKILQCYSEGNIAGYENLGGLVGINSTEKVRDAIALIENCYSRTNVTQLDNFRNYPTGSLVGCSEYNNATIKRCYATGIVKIGIDAYITLDFIGLAGRFDSNVLSGYSYLPYFIPSKVQFNYCVKKTIEPSDDTDFINAFLITELEAKDKDTYSGWDFVNVWNISEDINDGFPYLIKNPNPSKTKITEIEGLGTSASPYLITNEAQLIALADGEFDKALSAHYQLQNDIELTTKYWTPIGGNSMDSFKGVFDGNDFTISNLKIPQYTFENSGLFGVNEGTIRNLAVDVDITDAFTAGALTAVNLKGKILQCHSSGSVKGRFYVGGLVGYHTKGNIRESISLIEKSHSSVNVTSTESYAGGLVGYCDWATISRCTANGSVTAKRPDRAGRLVGIEDTSPSVWIE